MPTRFQFHEIYYKILWLFTKCKPVLQLLFWIGFLYEFFSNGTKLIFIKGQDNKFVVEVKVKENWIQAQTKMKYIKWCVQNPWIVRWNVFRKDTDKTWCISIPLSNFSRVPTTVSIQRCFHSTRQLPDRVRCFGRNWPVSINYKSIPSQAPPSVKRHHQFAQTLDLGTFFWFEKNKSNK